AAGPEGGGRPGGGGGPLAQGGGDRAGLKPPAGEVAVGGAVPDAAGQGVVLERATRRERVRGPRGRAGGGRRAREADAGVEVQGPAAGGRRDGLLLGDDDGGRAVPAVPGRRPLDARPGRARGRRRADRRGGRGMTVFNETAVKAADAVTRRAVNDLL